MKRYLFVLTITLLCNNLNAQDSLLFSYWTSETAITLPKHRVELGIFDESRYGLSNSCEISSHLIKSLLMPNFKIKKFWGNYNGLFIATQHGLFYPSPFLRMVAMEGTGGLISPEFDIPDMISITNKIVVSYKPLKNLMLSIYTGFKFAIVFGDLDARTTIDLPYFYPRLAVFYHQPEIDFGINARGKIISKIGWNFNIDNFLFTNTSENYFMENNLGLTYISRKQTFRIEAGYKLCYGNYAFGSQWHLLPLLSVAFKI